MVGQKSIEELLPLAVSGDQDALGELLRRHDGDLRRHIAPRIDPQFRSVIDEQDVVQTTYIEVHLHIQTFKVDGPGTFLGWMKKIAECNLADAKRGLTGAKKPPPTARVVATGNPDDSYVDLLERFPTSASKSPSGILSAKEAKEIAEKCLSELPPDYETVLRLSILAGLPGKEVAARMGRSVASIYMLEGRAFDRLEQLLELQPSFSGYAR